MEGVMEQISILKNEEIRAILGLVYQRWLLQKHSPGEPFQFESVLEEVQNDAEMLQKILSE